MNCIIASTSTIHGSDYLAYLQPELHELFKDIHKILFIPFARPSGITHDEYTQKAREGLAFLNKKVVGIHESDNYREAVKNAEAIFTGGGNTFLLVKQLHDHHLMDTLRQKIESGSPYLGTSAGSNICGPTMQTTNDMPIVMPKSFQTTGVLPFNINAHYLDPDANSTHKGETRETRIKEFHKLNDTIVVGLREGSWVRVVGKKMNLGGKLAARIFKPNEAAFEVAPNYSFNELS
ncbi:dipeptidase PepE [Mesonia sp. K7]|uniref:dipeptidase PepE n=1 Tax=Mesonia sp. K7 TaxID=2218606 RepID=UPI000DA905E7|nr:dipeptidase PepE [Mesonia sp. K7]PZD79681.1 dipeptidase PepE [Mesonia sp. K7]